VAGLQLVVAGLQLVVAGLQLVVAGLQLVVVIRRGKTWYKCKIIVARRHCTWLQ